MMKKEYIYISLDLEKYLRVKHLKNSFKAENLQQKKYGKIRCFASQALPSTSSRTYLHKKPTVKFFFNLVSYACFFTRKFHSIAEF